MLDGKILIGLCLLPTMVCGGEDADFFQNRVLPMMESTCVKCHDPEDSKGDVLFMEADDPEAIGAMRGVWRSVAVQLKNRTMPPPGKKQPDEAERVAVSAWIEAYLSKTALEMPPHAGRVTARRLNRLEYDLTIQDLCGVDLGFKTSLPMETGGGEGFDNNGETLYLPPLLMERYLEAAQSIVDAAIVSPPVEVQKDGSQILVSVYVDHSYEVMATMSPQLEAGSLLFRVDGVDAETVQFEKSERQQSKKVQLRLGRGSHLIEVVGPELASIRVRQKESGISSEQRTSHRQLLALDPGVSPKEADARQHAFDRLKPFLRKAFRRPIEDQEVAKLMNLYDRAAKRGDPFEERMKLVFKGVLVSPDFLFRIEKNRGSGMQRLSDHELAVRLSYFLWARSPDGELSGLADAGRLADEGVLQEQVNRLIDDPRSLEFSRAFIGQWMGTKDVGGRVAPVHNTIDLGYTNEVAADLREEGVRYFDYLLRNNRSVFELVDSDYALLTGRLVEYYKLESERAIPHDEFQRVSLPNRNRGGVLGMGAVHALTSHENRTSAVLRGAWVFDTLLGSPVPPPPTNVPPLKKSQGKDRTERQALEVHRQDSACMACHRMIDPIGFGLDQFDRLGRWREQHQGQKIDAGGEFPTGETFSGPAEMKQVLLKTQSDLILRQVIRKLLGYALGRNLTTDDDGTIERIVVDLKGHQFGTRQLIHDIVASTPFQFVENP